jgi:hypothetical protein
MKLNLYFKIDPTPPPLTRPRPHSYREAISSYNQVRNIAKTLIDAGRNMNKINDKSQTKINLCSHMYFIEQLVDVFEKQAFESN